MTEHDSPDVMNITIFPTFCANYASNIESVAWLNAAPGNITALLQRLGVIHWEQMASDWSIVIRAVISNQSAVYLKASPPGDETSSTIACLVKSDHPQLVRCIHADGDLGIHVLENVPGAPIAPDTDDKDQLNSIGMLLAELNQLDTQPGMIPLSRWCQDLLHPKLPIPQAISQNIERCRRLLSTTTSNAWIHGDLHHANIIQNTDTGLLVAIDPKGLVGDPSVDICTFVRNHIPENLNDAALYAFLERRIRVIAAAAGYPMDRAFAWAAAGNALSLLWDLPKTGLLETGHQHHLCRVVAHLSDLADRYGITG